jgi:membrane protease YdiL (CAAX protease family)
MVDPTRGNAPGSEASSAGDGPAGAGLPSIGPSAADAAAPAPSEPARLPAASASGNHPDAVSTSAAVNVATIASPPVPRVAWGFWGTIGWSLLCAVLFLVSQSVAAGVVLAIEMLHDPSQDPMRLALAMESNGLVVGLATVTSALVCVPFLVVIVRVPGFSLAESLGWRGFRMGQLALWGLLTLLLAAALDALTHFSGRPIVGPFMEDAYRTAGFLPLLIVALIVAAPVFEETFFRGFLYRGLAASWLGTVGAVVVTSLVFASIHVQYDVFGMATVLAMGLFMGAARARTGSVYLTILLHALLNLVALCECVVKLELMD